MFSYLRTEPFNVGRKIKPYIVFSLSFSFSLYCILSFSFLSFFIFLLFVFKFFSGSCLFHSFLFLSFFLFSFSFFFFSFSLSFFSCSPFLFSSFLFFLKISFLQSPFSKQHRIMKVFFYFTLPKPYMNLMCNLNNFLRTFNFIVQHKNLAIKYTVNSVSFTRFSLCKISMINH